MLCTTYATLMCLMASSSPKTHSCHLGSPYCIVPKIILETFRPDWPNRTGGTFSRYIASLVLGMILTIGHFRIFVGHTVRSRLARKSLSYYLRWCLKFIKVSLAPIPSSTVLIVGSSCFRIDRKSTRLNSSH